MFAALGGAATLALSGLLPIFGGAHSRWCCSPRVALGGWNFAPTALVPDFTRLSPLEGVKRLVGLRGLTELGKALLKFAVVGGVCAGVVAWLFGDVLALGRMAPRAAIGRGTGLLSWAFVWLCSSLALVAIVDVPLQLFQFKRTLRMTRQEVRDEHKEHDGSPRDQAAHPADAAGAGAPAHDAQGAGGGCRDRQPDALRRGARSTSRRACARRRSSPRAPTWSHRTSAASPRSIACRSSSRRSSRGRCTKSTDLNREIPAGLYMAVAQVLSYIFRVRTLNPTAAARMARPDPEAWR